MLKLPTIFRGFYLYCICLAFSANAEQYIGQWHLFTEDNMQVAQTLDGKHGLRIEFKQDNVTTIKITLNNFAGFGTENNWFEYSSPTYGRIRNADFAVIHQQVVISNPYEVHRLIENLKDIASHPIFMEDNLGNSFNERKFRVSFLASIDEKHLTTAAFSTIEIDEVLEHSLRQK
jgi:hypothetical protein